MSRIIRNILTVIIAVLSAQSALAVTPLVKILAPETSVDIASINSWKPQIPVINPIQTPDDMVPEFVHDMIDYAGDFIGTRYVRGGKRPGGFDCSGFTGYIFKQFGIDLNCNSRSQYTQGDAVATEELLPGDLVFFSGRAVSHRRVGHVGIVTKVNDDGSFDFIHASVSRGVIVSASTEPYYSKRYIGARRVGTTTE